MVKPVIKGVLETSLYVADLDRSERFYQALFGWPTKLGDDRMRALSIDDRQFLLLFARGRSAEGEKTARGLIPGHDGAGSQHMALAISAQDVEPWRAELNRRGIEIVSHVRPEQGGDSLYFRDPDGHLIELATPSIWNL